MAYLAEQVGGIVGREADVRADAPDAVHKARVATRRLRSALRTFRRLLDRDVTDPLRDEVRWLATALGAPRDAEVMKARILAALDALPEEEVIGPVRERVVTELDRRHAEGACGVGLAVAVIHGVRAGVVAADMRDDLAVEHLSMGMTDDFEVAIEEGATVIRVGRAIFGSRG